MIANLAQKASILHALYDYCGGQLSGAKCDTETAVENEDEEPGCGHASDAADILQVAIAFAEHGDMQTLLEDVNGHDTLVREDVYEKLEHETTAWDVLQAMSTNYYTR